MTTPGGYVLSRRNIPLSFGRKNPKTDTVPVSVKGSGFRGIGLDFGSTDLSVAQETYSFRTNKYSGVPDLTSGSEILRYFLMHGIQDSLDTGHDFYTSRSWTQYSHKDVFVSSGSGATWAKGTISAGAPPVPVPSSLNVNYYGNKAISIVSPTAPHTNLAQSAAELIREGIELPGTSLFGWLESRALFYRSVGKEYLNISFGWLPFLSDLISIVQAVKDVNAEIGTYLKLSGTTVRRRYDFSPIEETSHSESPYGFLNVGSGSNIASWDELYVGRAQGKLLIDDLRQENIYFKAMFEYVVPMDKSVVGRLQTYEDLANKILGTRITPAVLWELTPWSWLVDWFVDVQSALIASGYQTDFNKYAMRYAYLMRETKMSSTYTVVGPEFIHGPSGPFTSTTHLIKKERVRGTPFGFGINPEDMSPQHWAILAALAISKGPRKLPRRPKGPVTD